MADKTRDKLRSTLLKKIRAALPRVDENPQLVKFLELGSNDDLRRHLAWAQSISDAVAEPGWELSPRFPVEQAELMRKVLSSRTGAGLPHHCYVLARDECAGLYDGPEWVPFNLWQQFKYEGYGPLVCECARKLIESPGAEALWTVIGKRFPRPDQVSTNLANVCADALVAWRAIPRKLPAKFKETRHLLGRQAEKLASELERFFLPRDADQHELPGLLDFLQLMTEEEREAFDQAIRVSTLRIVNRVRNDSGARGLDWDEYNDIGEKARALGYQNEQPYRENYVQTDARTDAHAVYALLLPDHTRPDWPYGGVPTLPNMLRRIGSKFREDGELPPLARPKLKNAERNFFARFLCKYFWQSFGEISPAIVRDIVSIFFSQSMSENDVSHIAARVKRENPLRAYPETSPQ